jgi:excisionase family DNA binding protein
MVTEEKQRPRTVTIEEWAREVRVGRATAYTLARKGEIPGLLRLGGRWLVSRVAMDRMLEGQE